MRAFWGWLGAGRLTRHIGILLACFLIFSCIAFFVTVPATKVMLGAPMVWAIYLALHLIAKNANEI
jgi:hypothetical protein